LGDDGLENQFSTKLYTVGNQLTDKFYIDVNKVTSSYIDQGEEIELILYKNGDEKFFNIDSNTMELS
jgi:hypothetical protein